jgi:hypothetical protein
VGACDRERGARGDQAGRHGVQARGVQGILRPPGHARRAGECHVTCGYPHFRETVGEPECLDRGADDRNDVADVGPDHQHPDTDAHDQQPHTDADYFDPDPDTNDGDPHAYDHQRGANDAACDAHAVTRKYLSGHRPRVTQQPIPRVIAGQFLGEDAILLAGANR